MRYFFLILFVLSCVHLSAQTTVTKRSGFGLEFYPHLSNTRLLAGGTLSFREAQRRDSLEVATFGYGAGAFYALRGEKIGYHFGLRYLETGYDTERGPIESDPTLPSRGDFSEAFTMRMIEIPFYVNFYQNLNDRTSFFFTLGAAAGIHLKSTAERTFYVNGNVEVVEDYQPDGTLDYRGVNFAMLSAIGVESTFGESFTVGLSPNFEYWLGGNTVESPDFTTRNFYNLGVRLYVLFSK